MQLARGAAKYAVVPALAIVPGFLVTPAFGVVAALVTGFVVWFFRDPERRPPPSGVVSPADGKVSVIREEATDDGDRRLRVGVFMNVHDVHVNRAPVDGPVEAVEHVPGAHRPAFTKDSDRNERVHVDLPDHRVTLIAGAFARRITPYVAGGDDLERGAKIGHIAFGSRADVLFPPGVEESDLTVEKGESVTAGETVLARPGDGAGSDNLLADAPGSEG
jgi:phosphatidylserine decarboxylase